jgi:hypothetical protein
MSKNNVKKGSLQFELLNTYYQNSACNLSYTPLILKWANHADLMRINGVAGQFAELLEAAGVDTVKELKNRVAANLQPKMEEVNQKKNLVNRVPSLSEVERMIAQAKDLKPMMTY